MLKKGLFAFWVGGPTVHWAKIVFVTHDMNGQVLGVVVKENKRGDHKGHGFCRGSTLDTPQNLESTQYYHSIHFLTT